MLFHSHFTMKSDNVSNENDISHWKHDTHRHLKHNENTKRAHTEHGLHHRWATFVPPERSGHLSHK